MLDLCCCYWQRPFHPQAAAASPDSSPHTQEAEALGKWLGLDIWSVKCICSVSPVDPFGQSSGSIRPVQWIHSVSPVDLLGQSSGSIRSGSIRSVHWIHSASPVDPFAVDPFGQSSGSVRSIQWIRSVNPVDPFSQSSGSIQSVQWIWEGKSAWCEQFGRFSWSEEVSQVGVNSLVNG